MPFIGPPRNLSTTARNALATADRPTGMIIWNTSTSQLEVNSGTPASPTWIAVNASTWDSTWVARTNYLSGFSTTATSYVSTGLSITIPATGTFIVSWGAGSMETGAQGDNAFLSANVPGGPSDGLAGKSYLSSSGGTVSKEYSLTSGQTITVYMRCGNSTYGCSAGSLWITYSRVA